MATLSISDQSKWKSAEPESPSIQFSALGLLAKAVLPCLEYRIITRLDGSSRAARSCVINDGTLITSALRKEQKLPLLLNSKRMDRGPTLLILHSTQVGNQLDRGNQVSN
ncbi:hypothetical protein CEXT_376041 [Caerostris extrusa]|uniref:Uncharacterized protein n=1 Tax=Caerostris extrusa TaxID=172846 RepID=A0AAV4XFM7_CAEEX|nr:hypothetical protein CEXT_376041 [Caerostris extrusa]